MRNLIFTGNYFGEVITIKQVSRTTAKKLFNGGQRIFIQSSNFVPFGVWSNAIELNKEYDFEEQCNNFKYYNCSNSETGLYITYYKLA